MTRAEKIEIARAMRGEGLLLREIAAEFGVTYKTVSDWLRDPDGARLRERHQRYYERLKHPCERCGKPCRGKSMRRPSRICEACHNDPVWTRESIVEAIRAFHAIEGRIPSASDWNPAMGKHRRVPPVHDGYPTTTMVLVVFGKWNAAITAAGFTPRGAGEYEWER